MGDRHKTKEELVGELSKARRQNADLQDALSGLRKEAETLRQRLENYTTHFSIANDVMYTYDSQLRLLSVSPNVEKLLGYKPEELIGRNLQSLGVLDPSDVNDATEDALRVLSGQPVMYSIYRFITRSGERKFGEVSGVPIRKKGGEVTGAVSVARDITRRVSAEQELQKYRDHLEDLVGKRTDDLSRANAHLNHEIEVRMRSERALEESREFMRGITENIPGAVYQFYARENGEMGLHYVSGHILELMGLDIEPLNDLFERILARVAPEDQEPLLASIRDAVSNRSTWDYEARFIRQTGEDVYIRGISKPRQFGNELVFDGVMLDITAQRLAQKALQEDKERSRDLLREREELLGCMGDGIIVFDRSGKVIDVNPAYERMTGLSREDAVGKHGVDVTSRTVSADEVDKIVQSFASALAGESLPLITTSLLNVDGRETPICFTTSFIRDSGDKPMSIIAVIKDISDLKKAQDSLRESEERYRALVENANDIVFRTDNAGHFTFVNPAAMRITGYSEEEILGEQFGRFTREDMRDTVCGRIAGQKEKGIPSAYQEYPILSRQGQEIWIGLKTQLIVEGGAVTGIQGIARDVTERKRAEEEKARLENRVLLLQKAESLNRMAGAIAHIFNNHMQVVIGNLSLELYDNQRKDDRQWISNAMHAASKASEMSEFLLMYLGQKQCKREDLDLAAACRRHLPVLSVPAKKNVVVETDLPSTELTVKADENQIRLLLDVLFKNAREAIGTDEGSIRLRIRAVSPSDIPLAHRFPIDADLQDRPYACLEVTDTGHGIMDTDIEKIFDPFYTTKSTGRGMGLPVVLGIVRAHMGVITVGSTEGRGSAFSLFLPLVDKERC